MENIEWLLVELESNLLIRSIQAKIAAEVLRPRQVATRKAGIHTLDFRVPMTTTLYSLLWWSRSTY